MGPKTRDFIIVIICAILVTSCGDVQRQFSGKASDGSQVFGEAKAIGVSNGIKKIQNGGQVTNQDLLSVSFQSSNGWYCEIDYEGEWEGLPKDAAPLTCSGRVSGVMVPLPKGQKGVRFKLSNGITGMVML